VKRYRCLERGCLTMLSGSDLRCHYCIKSRLLANTRSDGECIVWTGRLSSAGYGVFPKSLGWAHQVAYRLAGGVVADGLELDHLCRNRACCNPAHLEPVTHRENIIRGHIARGTYRGGVA
jgi:hypothetical protein